MALATGFFPILRVQVVPSAEEPAKQLDMPVLAGWPCKGNGLVAGPRWRVRGREPDWVGSGGLIRSRSRFGERRQLRPNVVDLGFQSPAGQLVKMELLLGRREITLQLLSRGGQGKR